MGRRRPPLASIWAAPGARHSARVVGDGERATEESTCSAPASTSDVFIGRSPAPERPFVFLAKPLGTVRAAFLLGDRDESVARVRDGGIHGGSVRPRRAGFITGGSVGRRRHG